MTDKNVKSGVSSGLEDTKNLGRPADPEIKNQRPQVADKEKLAGAISSIEDLSARLARLDSQDGPFGTGSATAGTKMFDYLLDDVDSAVPVAQDAVTTDRKPPVETVDDEPQVQDAQKVPEDDDEMLITSLIVDDKAAGEDKSLSDLDAFFEEARTDGDEAQEAPGNIPDPVPASVTGQEVEKDASRRDDIPSAMSEILDDVEGEDYLGIMDEDIHDPIDDLIDESGADDDLWEDEVSSPEIQETSSDDAHASPFAALFSNVDVDFEDPGAQDGFRTEDRIHIEEYDPDDELFFTPDEESEIFGSSDIPDAVTVTSEIEDDDLLDINSSLYEAEDEAGENDDHGAISSLNEGDEDPIYEDQGGSSDLPVLTMGQDESLYAPGTSYDDEEEENSGEVGNDISEIDDRLQENEILVEKEDQMTISMNTSGKSEDALEEDKDFTTTDLDDLLGDDASQDDDGGNDEYYGNLADESLSDAALADLEEGDGAADTVVDAAALLFDDDLEAADDADEDLVNEGVGSEAEAGIPTPAVPAKKKRSKVMALAVASVSFLAILGGGYAYTNGMLPPIPGIPTYGAGAQVDVVASIPDRDMSPIIPVEVDKDDLGEEIAEVAVISPAAETGEGEDPEVAGENTALDLTTVDIDPEIAALLDEMPGDADADFKDSPVQDSIEIEDTLAGDFAPEDVASGEEPFQIAGIDDLPAYPEDLLIGSEVAGSDSDMDIAATEDDPEYLGEIQMPALEGEVAAESDIDLAAAEDGIDVSGTPEGETLVQEDATADTPVEDIDVAEMTPAASDVDDVVSTEMQDAGAADDVTALEGDLVGLAEVLQNEEMQEIVREDVSEAGSGDAAYDPLAALAAEIDSVGKPAVEDEVPAVVLDNSVFVEEERVIAIEETVVTLSESLTGVADEMKKLNQLIIQSMEQDAAVARRVEVNEQSLRTTSAILGELSSMKGSLDQTQVVLLDIAARVGTLEAANPADRQEVSEEIRQMKGEIQKLSANMSIIARMTVNGVTALTAEGASAGNHGVRTTTAKQPSAGNDMVFSNGESAPAAPKAPVIPKDVSKNDYIEGYGYVLDVVPASGNQKLVVMENGSALIPD